tara:strand:+ start:2293 stop:4080 length:1788 start_codon:yes stop_codon:yes gene_type:complete
MKNLKILFQIFDKNEKKIFIITIIFSFISTIFQFFGLSTVVPVVAILSDPDMIYNNTFVSRFYEFYKFESFESFRNFLLYASIVGILSSAALGLFNVYLISKFSFNFAEKIEQKLFNFYLNCNYLFHVKLSLPKIISNIANLIPRIKDQVLLSYMNLFVQFFMVLIVSATILIVDFYFSIFAIMTVSAMYLFFFKYFKKKVKYNGELITYNQEHKLKQVYEAISNIKFVNFIKNKVYFKIKHSIFSDKLAKTLIGNHLINVAPRHFMEVILFLGVIVSLLVMSMSDLPFSTILAKLSLFAIAAIKILPAINQIYSGVINIKSNEHALIEFKNEFQYIIKNNQKPKINNKEKINIQFNEFIEAKNINFKYDSTDFSIKNVNLIIKKNEFIGFCGKTGSGKTTIVDIISGLYEPEAGTLVVDGKTIENNNIDSFKSKIGYVPQDIYLGNNSIEKVITIGTDEKNIDKEFLKECTQKADIYDFIVSLPDGFNTICGDRGVRLSGGQKQRIGIARALYKNPEIIIFDESTNALDYFTENKIINTILELKGKVTLIVITHRIETIKNCDNIFIVSDGSIVNSGKYDQLLKDSNFFKQINN